MADIVEVHHHFVIVDPKHGTFSDTLIFPIEVYVDPKQITAESIDAEKQARYAGWIDQLENPPIPDPVEPTTALDDAGAVLAELASQISDIASKSQDAIAGALAAVAASKSVTDPIGPSPPILVEPGAIVDEAP